MNILSRSRSCTGLFGPRILLFTLVLAAVSLDTLPCIAGTLNDTLADTRQEFAAPQPPTAEDIATMLNLRFHIGLRDSLKIGCAVLDAARRDTISPFLLLAVIAVESNFDRFAVSVAGARGLMQVLPSQHKDVVLRLTDLNDASINVRIGSSILRGYVEAAGGDVHNALLRYSGGSRAYPRRVADSMNSIETAYSLGAHARAPIASSIDY